jgi:hypothetical protein
MTFERRLIRWCRPASDMRHDGTLKITVRLDVTLHYQSSLAAVSADAKVSTGTFVQ